PGGLEGDEQVLGSSQQAQELLVARSVLAERGRLEQGGASIVDGGDHVRLRGNVDPHVLHVGPLRRRLPGASVPVPLLVLVHARTRPCRPRDTVRALGTGRGRQSHPRGPRLKGAATTLSRFPSGSIFAGAVL